MRPTRITFDAGALVHNLFVAKRHAPDAKVIAMVKADGYGNGLSQVASNLAPYVEGFGVACIDEALALRQSGISNPIVLFEGCFKAQELELAYRYNFEVAIHTEQQLRDLLASSLPAALSVWIKINTGMNRLGFKPQQLASIYQQLQTCPWVDTIRAMTHFACGDELTNDLTERQMTQFYQVASKLGIELSLANSAGILAWPKSHADIIRPGIMLYGSSPFACSDATGLGLKPVMHFNAEIIAIHQLQIGECVGYGSRWCADKPSTIAVVAAGYGDGYPRVVDNRACVSIHGRRAPVIGRVSMDMLTIDISAIEACAIGDQVELWGKHILIDEIAASANTIAYELMCRATARAKDY